MKEDTVVVKIKFYDHGLGREQVIYGEVKASKIDRFETNEDVILKNKLEILKNKLENKHSYRKKEIYKVIE